MIEPKPIPPARVATTAGVFGYVPPYDPGRSTNYDRPPQVVPVLNRPMDTNSPMQVEGITIRPAKSMDRATAEVTLARIIADAKVWMKDFPHEVHGEAAEVINFFNALIVRQRHRADAQANGQPIEPDAIDNAVFSPLSTAGDG